MLHIASLWEAAPVNARSDLCEIVHRSRRGRGGTTILGAEFAFDIDLLGVSL